jgi:hypothetical protein
VEYEHAPRHEHAELLRHEWREREGRRAAIARREAGEEHHRWERAFRPGVVHQLFSPQR